MTRVAVPALLLALAFACGKDGGSRPGSDLDETGDDTAAAGRAGAGGRAGTGGSPATGGRAGTGGSPATGGSGGSAGVGGGAPGGAGGGGAGGGPDAGMGGAGGPAPADAASGTDAGGDVGSGPRDAADRPSPPPSGTVIDTHTHFFDPKRPNPAGRNQPIPWPGSGSPLYKTTLPEDYLKLARPLGITATVVVEASPWLEDNDWILALAEKDKVIVGFVGNLGEVWGDAGKFDAALTKYRRNPLFRGIRVGGAQARAGATAGVAQDNFKKLAAADLSVDVLGASFDEINRLAKAVPALRIVVDHMGSGFRVRETPEAAWVSGIEAIAANPNVFLKISGLVEGAGGTAPTDAAAYKPSLDVVWKAFGEDRLIYGTNWPVSGQNAPLSVVHDIVKKYLAAKGKPAEDKVFAGNALRAYKWVKRD